MRFAVPSLSLLSSPGRGRLPDLAPPTPPPFPHAEDRHSHVDVDGDRTDIFRLLEVDGRRRDATADLSVK